jgi:hypothetical protein
MKAISMNDFPPLINKVQEKPAEVFDPEAILAVNMEITSSQILDKEYLLLACEKGLFFVDLKAEVKIPVKINNIRSKLIHILYSQNVLVCQSGKHDHIRQYKLESIRKQIMYLQGEDANVLRKMDFSNSIQEATIRIESDELLDSVYTDAQKPIAILDEEALFSKWCKDYIKISGTQACKSFIVRETETTIYLIVLFKQDLTLFEWAKNPYNKFMKNKTFWLPGNYFNNIQIVLNFLIFLIMG